MKINAIQLKTQYNQEPFGNNTARGTMQPAQITGGDQFTRSIVDSSIVNTRSGQTKSLSKVLDFFKPRAKSENIKYYSDADLSTIISERQFYL